MPSHPQYPQFPPRGKSNPLLAAELSSLPQDNEKRHRTSHTWEFDGANRLAESLGRTAKVSRLEAPTGHP